MPLGAERGAGRRRTHSAHSHIFIYTYIYIGSILGPHSQMLSAKLQGSLTKIPFELRHWQASEDFHLLADGKGGRLSSIIWLWRFLNKCQSIYMYIHMSLSIYIYVHIYIYVYTYLLWPHVFLIWLQYHMPEIDVKMTPSII